MFGMGWTWLIGLVLVVLVIWAVARMAARPDARTGDGRDDAEQILERRFANGEIDEQEYRARKQALHGG
jgi:putative membrane protein